MAELLVQSKVALTLDTYSHVVPGMLDKVAERKEELVSASPLRLAR